MHTVIGPILTRDGGYAFDSWTPEVKLTRFRGAGQAFNGGFSDAQDASALFT